MVRAGVGCGKAAKTIWRSIELRGLVYSVRRLFSHVDTVEALRRLALVGFKSRQRQALLDGSEGSGQETRRLSGMDSGCIMFLSLIILKAYDRNRFPL